ncbi:MAG: Pleiotropic regulator 1 [Marteilia pararefringens]
MVDAIDDNKFSLHSKVFRDLKRSHEFFLRDYGKSLPFFEDICKILSEYGVKGFDRQKSVKVPPFASKSSKNELIMAKNNEISNFKKISNTLDSKSSLDTYFSSNLPDHIPLTEKPKFHPPWKLYRVIAGHYGWVRCIAVEPYNQWFATGSSDRMIKIWDLATGKLKLSLTGHISAIRDLVISDRHPYMFSCGEDKQIKCWDLECNKVIRHYHGHHSGVYCLDIHPVQDILISGSRDSSVNIWDIRTKLRITSLDGHKDTISDIVSKKTDPQIITSSYDKTIRLWDLRAFSTLSVLTNHKKSVRSLALNDSQNILLSSSTGSIKQWILPNGKFYQNFACNNSIVNSIACNQDGVVVSGGDNGILNFYDFKSAHLFQENIPMLQSGSLSAEAGALDLKFDISGSRLITANIDKTIKLYKENIESDIEMN